VRRESPKSARSVWRSHLTESPLDRRYVTLGDLPRASPEMFLGAQFFTSLLFASMTPSTRGVAVRNYSCVSRTQVCTLVCGSIDDRSFPPPETTSNRVSFTLDTLPPRRKNGELYASPRAWRTRGVPHHHRCRRDGQQEGLPAEYRNHSGSEQALCNHAFYSLKTSRSLLRTSDDV
jgi:hypothetical protein